MGILKPELDDALLDELAMYGEVLDLAELRECLAMANTVFCTGTLTSTERARATELLALAKSREPRACQS